MLLMFPSVVVIKYSDVCGLTHWPTLWPMLSQLFYIAQESATHFGLGPSTSIKRIKTCPQTNLTETITPPRFLFQVVLRCAKLTLDSNQKRYCSDCPMQLLAEFPLCSTTFASAHVSELLRKALLSRFLSCLQTLAKLGACFPGLYSFPTSLSPCSCLQMAWPSLFPLNLPSPGSCPGSQVVCSVVFS